MAAKSKEMGYRLGFIVALFPALVPMRIVAQAPIISKERVDASDIPSDWRLQESGEAIRQTLKILGVSESEQTGELGITAKLVSLKSDNTPFLTEQIVGRPVWQVVIRRWKLEVNSAPPNCEDKYKRTFDVFVGAETGRLLKIVSRWPEGAARIPPEPGAHTYADQMQQYGEEKYHAFPEDDPKIDFLHALDALRDSALVAEQIVAQYVVWSEMGRDHKPVWAITLRRTEAIFPGSYPGVPVDARNHFRYIVDAADGKRLCGSTTPQPVVDRESPEDDSTGQ